MDGLGRLRIGYESVAGVQHDLQFSYDMRSQLTAASISNIGGTTWTGSYTYRDDGNLDSTVEGGTSSTMEYDFDGNSVDDGDILTGFGIYDLTADWNGNMTRLPLDPQLTPITLEYNWDNKVRKATQGGTELSFFKYDPMGNRVSKSTYNGTVSRKYIVDVVGELPVILCELDDSDTVLQSYVYVDGQPIHHKDHTYVPARRSYYVHDRLGSVRMALRWNGSSLVADNTYVYSPFGNMLVETGTAYNPFKFTGQWHDAEINEYYLRARQYDPTIMRFMSRDPAQGEREEPLTLHRYLYCANDPLNKLDPSGAVYINVANAVISAATVFAAGLQIAAYGAEKESFELIMAGYYVSCLAPVAYTLGLGFADKMVTVTRWGDPGTGPGWVMAGRKGWLKWLLSGKWQPGFTNQFAAYGTGHSWQVMSSELSFPSGWKWVFGFIGQLVYNP